LSCLSVSQNKKKIVDFLILGKERDNIETINFLCWIKYLDVKTYILHVVDTWRWFLSSRTYQASRPKCVGGFLPWV